MLKSTPLDDILNNNGEDANLLDLRQLSSLSTDEWKNLLIYLQEHTIETLYLPPKSLNNERAKELLEVIRHDWFIISALRYNEHLIDRDLKKEIDEILARNNRIYSLYHAIKSNDLETVKKLKNQITEFSIYYDIISSPLYVASFFGHLEIVKYLHNNGIDVNIKKYDGFRPLHVAAYKTNFNIAKYLIENGAEVDKQDNNGNTALALAAFKGDLDIVKLLLDSNAFINLANKDNYTAFYNAVAENNLDVVKYLESQNADIHMPNISGFTPLHIASKYGLMDIFQFLIEKGAHIDAKTNLGKTALMLAISEKQSKVIELLVKNGAHINDADNEGLTPLHYAASIGHQESINLLLEHHANINAQDHDGNTPLLLAALGGHLDSVILLCEKDADIFKINNIGATCLFAAIENNHIDIIHYLLQKGVQLKPISEEHAYKLYMHAVYEGHLEALRFLEENGINFDLIVKVNPDEKPLHVAAELGQIEIVKYFIENDVFIDTRDDDGDSPLLCAIQEGHFDIVKFLLTHGANIDFTGNQDMSAISAAIESGNLAMLAYFESKKLIEGTHAEVEAFLLAAAKGYLDVITYLIQKGFNVNAKTQDGNTALIQASKNGQLEVVKCLLAHKADVNLANEEKVTPFFAAIKNGYLDIIKYLESKGADINSANHAGLSPLHAAVACNKVDIVKFLLGKKAKVNLVEEDDNTPLIYAAEVGNLEICKQLIQHGAQINLSNNRGFSSLYVAACHGHLSIVKYLMAVGEDNSKANNNGFTPLHIASENGHHEIVNLLIKNKENINDQDKNGDTPLIRAALNGHFEVVKELVKSNAKLFLTNSDHENALYAAIYSGKYNVVSYLMEHGLKLYTILSHQKLELYKHACINGHWEMIELLSSDENFDFDIDSNVIEEIITHGNVNALPLLKQNGIKLDEKDYDGDRPLTMAAACGDIACVKFLIESGASIDAPNDAGVTPLCAAVIKGDLATIEYLISNRANLNIATGKGKTPLHLAVKSGNVDVVNVLLANGANIDARDSKKQTPLHIAAKRNQLEILKTLISNKAQINTLSSDASTPLYSAAKAGHLDIVRYLESIGVNINATCKEFVSNPFLQLMAQPVGRLISTLLMPYIALEDLNLGVVEMLSYGTNFTPLYIAAKGGHLDIVKFLIEHGVDIDKSDFVGNRPRDIAIEEGRYDVVDYFYNIDTKPIYAPLYCQRGNIKLASNDLKGAQAEYDKALALDPTYAHAYYFHGKVNENLNKIEDALSDYSKAINLQPKLFNAFKARGKALQKIKKHQEALQDFDNLIALNPSGLSYIDRGDCKQEINAYHDAIKDYTQAIQLNANGFTAYKKRADAKVGLGKLKDAISDYTTAIKLNPNEAAIYLARGITYEKLDELAFAIADYEQALQLNPNDENVKQFIELAKQKIDDPVYHWHMLLNKIKTNNPDLVRVVILNNIPENQIHHLCEALKNNNHIKQLVINAESFNSECLKLLLQAIKANNTLTELTLNKYSIKIADIDEINQLIKMNNSLTELNFTHADTKDIDKYLKDSDATIFKALVDNYTLTQLFITNLHTKPKLNSSITMLLKRNQILEPLQRAIKNENLTMISDLLRKGILVKDTLPWVLKVAYDQGNASVIKFIINKYVDLDATNDGVSPMLFSCKDGKIELIKKYTSKREDESKNSKMEQTLTNIDLPSYSIPIIQNQSKKYEIKSIEALLKTIEKLHKNYENSLIENKQDSDSFFEDSDGIYVEPDVGSNKTASKRYPISQIIDQFIENPNQLSLLLLGDAGLGKTLFTKQLFSKSWQKFKDEDINSFIIPIHIPLTSIDEKCREIELLETHLKKYLSPKKIKLLKENCQKGKCQLLIILDGFDEITSPLKSFYESNNWLVNWGGPKVITTSRPEAFEKTENHQSLFYPTQGMNHAFQEYFIQSFNKQQIEEYLGFINKEQAHQEELSYLTKIHPLPELIENPLILSMLVKILPSIGYNLQINYDSIPNTSKLKPKVIYLYIADDEIYANVLDAKGKVKALDLCNAFNAEQSKSIKSVLNDKNHALTFSDEDRKLVFARLAKQGYPPKLLDKANNAECITYTREQIYSEFIDYWLSFQIKRVLKDPVKKEKLKEHYIYRENETFEEAFKKCLFNYLQNLSIISWNKGNGKLTVALNDAETLQKELLTTSNNGSEFINSDYNIEDILKLIRSCVMLKCGNGFRKFFHKSVLEFFASKALFTGAQVIADNFIKSLPNIDTKFALNDHLLSSEPHIVTMLADLVTTNNNFKKLLYRIIEASKGSEVIEVAAANAITILKASGEVFNNKQWQNIQISNADLSGAICEGTDFSGADLTGVNFENAWIKTAIFDHAILDNAKFSSTVTFQDPSVLDMSGGNGQFIIFIPQTNQFYFKNTIENELTPTMLLSSTLNRRPKLRSIEPVLASSYTHLNKEELTKDIISSENTDQLIKVGLEPTFSNKSNTTKPTGHHWHIKVERAGEQALERFVDQNNDPVCFYRAISDNKRYLVIGASYNPSLLFSGNTQMKVVDLEKNKILNLNHDDHVQSLIFSQDDKWLLSVLSNNVHVEDIETGKSLHNYYISSKNDEIVSAAINVNKDFIAIATKLGFIDIFETKHNKLLYHGALPWIIGNQKVNSLVKISFYHKETKDYLKFVDENACEYLFKLDFKRDNKLILKERRGQIEMNSQNANITAAIGLSEVNETLFKQHSAIGQPLKLNVNELTELIIKQKDSTKHVEVRTNSQINKNYYVDFNNWVVSLLRNPYSGESSEHAYLILEGMNEFGQILSSRCEFITHENGVELKHDYGKVKMVNSRPEKIKNHRAALGNLSVAEIVHGVSWPITREKGKELLKSIETENTKFFPYKVFATKKAHNCFTWAKEKLMKLKIECITNSEELKDSFGDRFFSITSTHLNAPPGKAPEKTLFQKGSHS